MSTETNDGGPAFPGKSIIGYESSILSSEPAPVYKYMAGMTLRDYFIAHIDLGDVDITVEEAKELTGENCPNWRTDYMGNLKYWAKVEAILKGIKADAMLAERSKG